jgi:hypothetical protein
MAHAIAQLDFRWRIANAPKFAEMERYSLCPVMTVTMLMEMAAHPFVNLRRTINA